MTAPQHFFAGEVTTDFANVVTEAAKREQRTFTEMLVQLAIEGAECRRQHKR